MFWGIEWPNYDGARLLRRKGWTSRERARFQSDTFSQLKNEYAEQTTFVNTCKMYNEKHNNNNKRPHAEISVPRYEFRWEESERIKMH